MYTMTLTAVCIDLVKFLLTLGLPVHTVLVVFMQTGSLIQCTTNQICVNYFSLSFSMPAAVAYMPSSSNQSFCMCK